jgi:hypothetical protein
MIELNFRTINENIFHDGVAKLANSSAFSPKEAYHISRIVDKVGQHTKEARLAYSKLIAKYAKKDEKDRPIMTKTAPFFELKDDAKMEEWAKEYEEFLDIKVAIDKNKIPVASLPSALGLSPREIQALEPLLDFEETPEVSNVIPLK